MAHSSYQPSCTLLYLEPSQLTSIEEYKPLAIDPIKTISRTKTSLAKSEQLLDHTITSSLVHKREDEMVGIHHKIKNDHATNCTRRKKKKRSPKEMVGGQHRGMDRVASCHNSENSRRPDQLEGSCQAGVGADMWK